MTQKIKKIIHSALVFFGLTLPTLAAAQCTSNCVQQGLTPISGIFPQTGIGGAHSLTTLIAVVIQYMLLFAGGIAVIFVIIGGFQYITSAGNGEAAEKGRQTLTNAIIGIIVIVLSYTIITVIANLVSTPNGYGF